MSYTRVNWKDYPDTTTPLNAENLNKMDLAISEMDTEIGDTSDLPDSTKNICENIEEINSNLSTLSSYRSWKLLGYTSGTTQLSFDLTNYNEVCVCTGTPYYKFSDTIPKAYLSSTAARFSNSYSSTSAVTQSVRYQINLTSAAIELAWQNGADNTASANIYVYAR